MHSIVCAARLNFLKSAIEAHGDCSWHIITSSVTPRFGIFDDKDSGRSGTVKLAFEMRFVKLLVCFP